ncbi:MAG: hypothetical protein ACREQ2_11870 [Candidatus Binatia bacterium]
MTLSYSKDNLAIYAYGSLLSDPGEKLAPRIIAGIPRLSPWPIEYARRAKLRGNGPTLVIHESGASVRGKLLILDAQVDAIDQVEEWLWEREGKPPRAGLKRMEWSGFRQVLYCDLESTLGEIDLNADALARFAIDSVRNNPARNAIRYLAQNIEQGVITPLTHRYREAILRVTGTPDLRQAEELLLRSAR